uniref:Netrin-1 n=1 Tax=Parastrongyloides trichosuri TaxID=131310 RepID=A0A0N5A3D9_PARTI
MILMLLSFLLTLTTNLINGAYFSQFSMKQPDHDPCYDSSGRPIKCVPDFINAAFGKPVIASSTCGVDGPSRFCAIRESANGLIRELCDVCDASIKSKSHPASLLTDLNNARNLTCWISEPSLNQNENVTLTLSLGKKFELTYISMQFCNKIADSMAIYKSVDFGKNWIPFQYYSSQCMEMYGKEVKDTISPKNEQEAICTNSHTLSPTASRVAFATLEGRPSAFRFEQSPILQDWVTATDIRIVFNKPAVFNDQLYAIASSNNITDEISSDVIEKSYYSMAELAVGGRCKCNGHASRCIYDKKGQYTCDCKHNTAGNDCERCKPFHYDRPWARATSDSANACVACNCNLHARKCRFNAELYRLSGNKSGGICINCRHNTAGRNCHYCKPGFYRDNTKAITHRRACKACGCHLVGSLSKSCNQTSGQCICKPGVTGQTCNRCAKGYQQSRNPQMPCTKILPVMKDVSKNSINCEKCKVSPKRVNLKKFCKRQLALQFYIISREIVTDYVKYEISIERIYKKNEVRIKKGSQYLWLPEKMAICKCPKLRIGQRYIILGGSSMKDGRRQGLSINNHSIVMDWSEEHIERLTKFVKREKNGECDESEEE